MKKFYNLFISLIVSLNAFSQSASIDLSFNSTDVGNGNGDGPYIGPVNVSALQTDGKLIIGGVFNKYNGTTRNYIARINSNGKLDSTFEAGTTFNTAVSSIAVQNDGKILAASYLIKRFNSDGTLDSTFYASASVNGLVDGIAIQNDGKIFCVGSFTLINGTVRNRIARLNTDGSVDTTFNPGTGADNTIYCIVLQPDNNILIGGDFTSYNSSSRNHMARIYPDGTLDTTFLSSGGANNKVSGIAIQSDGKILAGGNFTSFTNAINRIVRINTDGSVDSTFNPGTGASANISSIVIQADGKIVIGGSFTTYSGNTRKYIARTNLDGSVDTTFNPLYGLNSAVNTIAIESSGRIIAGGDFMYANTNRLCIAGFNPDGSLDVPYNAHTGVGGIINSMAIQSDGKIIIGGRFGEYNGILCNNIARLNTDGTFDTTYQIGTGVMRNPWIGNYGGVNAMAIQSDGKVIIGGSFYSYNGYSRDGIARINTDGSTDTTFTPTSGVNYVVDGTIEAIAIQSDGKILIGGDFEFYNGISRYDFARVNSDGSLDASFIIGTGVSGSLQTIAIQADGKIIIGGYFSSYNGTSKNSIARINTDGSLDATFTGNGANGGVLALLIQTDGKVIIAGSFTSYNSSTRHGITRINPNNTADTTFNPGTGVNYSINTAEIQTDGKIMIVGDFNNYNGTVRNGIARINSDGSLDTGFDPGSGMYNSLNNNADIKIQPDGRILIGGYFTSYNGTGRNRIARLEGTAVGIEEHLHKLFYISPNPTSTIFSIHLTNELQNARLNIYNVTGSEVYSISKITGREMQINCSEFSPGIYFARVTDGEKAWTQKLVIE